MLAPPVGPMLAEADRRRRRRRDTIGGAVLAVVATLGLADTVTAVVNPGPEAWPATSPPDGMRFVGIGRAVIAVPNGWANDAIRCGQPVRDTVVLDPGPGRPAGGRDPPTSAASRSSPASRARVSLPRRRTTSRGGRSSAAPPPAPRAPARRWCTCRPRTSPSRSRRPPSGRSAPGPRSAGLVQGLRVLDGIVAVPTTGALAADYGRSARGRSTSPTCVTSACTRWSAPSACPAPMPAPSPASPRRRALHLRRGSDVAVTVADGELTARDEVAVGLASVDDNRTYRGLTHEDFLRGATLEVPQGTDIWGVRGRPPVRDPRRPAEGRLDRHRLLAQRPQLADRVGGGAARDHRPDALDPGRREAGGRGHRPDRRHRVTWSVRTGS